MNCFPKFFFKKKIKKCSDLSKRFRLIKTRNGFGIEEFAEAGPGSYIWVDSETWVDVPNDITEAKLYFEKVVKTSIRECKQNVILIHKSNNPEVIL